MAEITVDVTVANRFISSLSKSLQALCHGCMDFNSGIEIVGYININIDSGSKVDYVLNEKVLKSNTNSMTFVSNSFLAKKDQPKQLRDGACSPVQELQSFLSGTHRNQYHNSGYQHHRSFPYSSQSHVLRGSQKRSWSGMDREWRVSPKKHYRGAKTSFSQSRQQSYGASTSQPSASETLSQSGTATDSFLQPESSSSYNSTNNSSAAVNIKKEHLDNNDESAQNEVDNLQNVDNANETSSFDSNVNIKCDPDAVPENGGDKTSPDTKTDLQNSFLDEPKSNEQTMEGGDPPQNSSSVGDFTLPLHDSGDSNENVSENMAVGEQSTEMPVEYNETGDEIYPQSSYGDHSQDDDQFDVIEIGDEEDEEVQAMFGDADPMQHGHLPDSQWNYDVDMASFLQNIPESNHTVTDTPFMCPYCPQSFVTDPVRQRHMSVSHPRLMPYCCLVCGKGFKSLDSFRGHKKVHADRRSICPICKKRFSRNHHLKRHLQGVHKRKWCTRCARTFPLDSMCDIHGALTSVM